MSKAIATSANVFQTADQLAAAGDEPSVDTIQAQLGGGSLSTISKYLKLWRAARAADLADPVPQNLLEETARLVTQVWRQSGMASRDSCSAERAGLAAQLESQKRDADCALREVDRLEREVDLLSNALEAERQAHELVRAALASHQLKAENVETSLDELQQECHRLRHELTQANERQSELVQLLKHMSEVKQVPCDRVPEQPAVAN